MWWENIEILPQKILRETNLLLLMLRRIIEQIKELMIQANPYDKYKEIYLKKFLITWW